MRFLGRTFLLSLLAGAGWILIGTIQGAQAGEFEDSFDQGMGDWEPLAPEHWQITRVEGNPVLHLAKNAAQRPPVRRPGMYILSPAGEVSNVRITCRVRTLVPPEVKQRDICVIFGYRDDTHFYYAHISSLSDNKVHNVIMRVEGDQRIRINLEDFPKALLSDDWQTVTVEHREYGDIRVWVDGELNMTAHDTTYPVGRVGLGSFDDTAMFDDFSIQPFSQ